MVDLQSMDDAINRVGVTVGFDKWCDYRCDGIDDDVQIQSAINYLYNT